MKNKLIFLIFFPWWCFFGLSGCQSDFRQAVLTPIKHSSGIENFNQKEVTHIDNLPIETVEYLPGDPIFIWEDLSPSMNLFNVNDEVSSSIENYSFKGWEANGCEILASSDRGDLYRIKLNSEELQKLLSIDSLERKVKNLFNIGVFPSPTNEWAYFYTSDYGCITEMCEKPKPKNPNIGLVSLLNQNELKMLSNNGGADSVQWSPNSSLLAFTDFDSNKIKQVYLFDIQKSLFSKLTSFNDPNQGVLSIKWSPNGQYLAINIKNAEKNSVQIFDLENNTPLIILEGKYIFWWIDDKTILLSSGDSVNIFDITQSKTIRDGTKIFFNNGIFFPFRTNSNIGFFKGNDFLVYDYDQNRLFQIDDLSGQNLFDYIIGWHVSPLDFPGLDQCNK